MHPVCTAYSMLNNIYANRYTCTVVCSMYISNGKVYFFDAKIDSNLYNLLLVFVLHRRILAI